MLVILCNTLRRAFLSEITKKSFVVLCYFFFAFSAVELFGISEPNQDISFLAEEQTELLPQNTISEKSTPQTYSPVAIPVLSQEEALKANEDSLRAFNKRTIMRFVTDGLLIVVCILGVAALCWCLTIRYKREQKSLNRNNMQGIDKDQRLLFLDIMKGIAIVAVICNHCITASRLCPLSFLPVKLTYFSVTLFIICAGYTSAMSLEKARTKNISTRSWIIKKTTHIICYYFIATAFYLFIKTPTHIISFSSFVDACTLFNAAGPFYYIAFFLQLLCIAPLTFGIFSAPDTKKRFLVKTLVFFLLIFVSLFCMSYTSIGNIFGGGRYLFGGTYLIVYVLGQIIYIYRSFFLSRKVSAVIALVAFLTYRMLDAPSLGKFQYIIIINPPGLLYIFYAVFVFFAIVFLFSFHICSRISSTAFYPISFLGRFSFEIFLYHIAIISFLNNYIRYANDESGGGASWTRTCKQQIFLLKRLLYSQTLRSRTLLWEVPLLHHTCLSLH